MPARSRVYELPPELRAEVDRKLIGSGFGDYTGLTNWLAQAGHIISRTALHRYGQSLEAQVASMQQNHHLAIAICKELPDDEGAKADLLNNLSQDTLFVLLLRLHRMADELPEGAAIEDLQPITKLIGLTSRAAAEINRASVAVKKHAAETRQKVEQKFAALEERRELDPETLKAVFEAVRGAL